MTAGAARFWPSAFLLNLRWISLPKSGGSGLHGFQPVFAWRYSAPLAPGDGGLAARPCASQAIACTAGLVILSSHTRSAGVLPARARCSRRWLYACFPAPQFGGELGRGAELSVGRTLPRRC